MASDDATVQVDDQLILDALENERMGGGRLDCSFARLMELTKLRERPLSAALNRLVERQLVFKYEATPGRPLFSLWRLRKVG